MPRYMVERSFPEGLKIPVNEEGAKMCRLVVLNNEEDSVTLILQYYHGEKGVKIDSRKKLAERFGVPINTLRMRALRIRENLQRRVENCQKQCKSNCTDNFGDSYFKVERQEQQRQPYRQKGACTIPVARLDAGGAARGRRPSAPRQTAPLGSRSRRSAA